MSEWVQSWLFTVAQVAPGDPSAPVNPWVIVFLFGTTISGLAVYIHRQDQKTIDELKKRLARWEDIGGPLVEVAAAQPDPPPTRARRRPPSHLPSPLISPPRPGGGRRPRRSPS